MNPKKIEKIQEYNAEPVSVCMKCMTLNVKYSEELGIAYCGECSSYISIKKLHINKYVRYMEMLEIINKFKNKGN